MEWTKFDTRLQSLSDKGIERLVDYAPGTAFGVQLKAVGVAMLDKARGLLGPAVARAQAESHDAYLASQTIRTLEGAAEDAWETLYIDAQGRVYARLLEDREAGLALQSEVARVVGEWTPTAFRALGLDRTILVLETLSGLAGKVVGEDAASLAAARTALGVLRTAREVANREAGEAISAAQALEAARDEARNLYVGARRAIGTALYLDRNEGALDRYLAPLFPSTSAGAGGDVPVDVDVPPSGGEVGVEPVV